MPDPFVRISAINIVVSNRNLQGRENYARLWKQTFELRSNVRVRGDTRGMIGSLSMRNSPDTLWGDLFKFSALDPDAPWLNLDTGQAAADETMKQIQIPPQLRPNLRIVPYYFFPNVHSLVFASRLDAANTFAPRLVATLLMRLFDTPIIKSRFGPIEVTVEPDPRSLDNIFNLSRLKRLEITIKRPNALGNAERRLFKRMYEVGADRIEQVYVAKSPQGLQPDDEIKEIAQIAASNGSVTARGEDLSGEIVERSTKDQPLEEKIDYNPATTDARKLVETAAADMRLSIINSRGFDAK